MRLVAAIAARIIEGRDLDIVKWQVGIPPEVAPAFDKRLHFLRVAQRIIEKAVGFTLAPYALKGFLWYQGESNCFLNDTLRYPEKMKTLIESWRNLWVNANLPFYYVQIAPF